MKKRLVFAAVILFYAGMLGITFSARALHKAELPHVRVLEIEYETFTDKDGNSAFSAALPKELYQEELYRIGGEIINDEYRTVARRVTVLELGLENEEFYQVKNGINAGEQIIVGSPEGITDGCEVYIVEVGKYRKSPF